MQTAIQLWTLRNLSEPLSAVLDRIAAAGYDGVEFAGVGDPGASRRALDDAGLGVVGAHVGIDALQSETSAVVRQLDSLEVPFVVVPYLDVDHFTDADAVATTAAMLDTLDATYDRPLLYHNHDHEFGTIDGETAFDRLVDETSVGFELDAGWAHAAGRDPVDRRPRPLRDRPDGRLGGDLSVFPVADLADCGPVRLDIGQRGAGVDHGGGVVAGVDRPFDVVDSRLDSEVTRGDELLCDRSAQVLVAERVLAAEALAHGRARSAHGTPKLVCGRDQRPPLRDRVVAAAEVRLPEPAGELDERFDGGVGGARFGAVGSHSGCTKTGVSRER